MILYKQDFGLVQRSGGSRRKPQVQSAYRLPVQEQARAIRRKYLPQSNLHCPWLGISVGRAQADWVGNLLSQQPLHLVAWYLLRRSTSSEPWQRYSEDCPAAHGARVIAPLDPRPEAVPVEGVPAAGYNLCAAIIAQCLATDTTFCTSAELQPCRGHKTPMQVSPQLTGQCDGATGPECIYDGLCDENSRHNRKIYIVAISGGHE